MTRTFIISFVLSFSLFSLATQEALAHSESAMMESGGGMVAGHMIFGGLLWLALIFFLLAGSYFFIKQANRK